MDRRTGPLLVVLVLASTLLVVRLAQIQLGQHAVWAEEAAGLLHSSHVVPYRRGKIQDAASRVLASDQEAYHLLLSYRDFRRHHPLGQIAHARSLLERRPLSLQEAWPDASAWALHLASLSPSAIDAFGEGGELRVGPLVLSRTDDPAGDRRRSRASDLHYYVAGLLELTPRERADLVRARRSDATLPSYAELAASWRPYVDFEDVRAELVRRVDLGRSGLELLADELGLGADAGDGGARPAFDVLVDVLEERRRDVESRAASSLFAEVCGFPSGRVEPRTLRAHVDLDWLRSALGWDAARLDEWLAASRADWLGWRDGYALPWLLAGERALDAAARDPERLLALLAAPFLAEDGFQRAMDGRPIPWRELRSFAVFDSLGALFASEPPRGSDPGATRPLPILAPAFLAAHPPSAGRLAWDVLAPSGAAPAPDAAHAPHAPQLDWIRERAGATLARWEAQFQREVDATLGRLRAAARPRDLTESGRLAIERGWLDRLDARVRYLLIDHGNREHLLERDPEYEVVYLLTRHEERFPGFVARDARERQLWQRTGESGLPAAQLVGRVLGADPEDMRRQRRDLERLVDLAQRPSRTAAEDDELELLLGVVRFASEPRGVSGIEGYWDEELRGRNGYVEQVGLEDVFGHGRVRSERPPVDGRDVRLTLRADVQGAAERVLAHPQRPDDPQRDDAWYDHPVGALVLLSIEGDLVAAASGPTPHAELPPDTPERRARRLERTLGMPDFQPPGSVFKPFVAARALHALDGYDPRERVACAPEPDGPPEYGDLRCWTRWGHGEVDLRGALLGSCNVYFAQLGERLGMDDFRALADSFGFGEETGVQQIPGRGGLREVAYEALFQKELSAWGRRAAANGLAVVQATPVQVARAFAGLARGSLPFVRVVERVGGHALPRRAPEPIGIAPDVLAAVRAALADVANEPGGTAYAALNETLVGYRVAVKTGSGDLTSRDDDGGRARKHTWVAGWLPAEDPVCVFVVFVYDTTATSSHGAVYVARQLLVDETVRAWLAEQGVERR